MSFQPRIPEKFENAGGTVSQAFPLGEFEWESVQPLRSAVASLVGAHYGFDFRGDLPGIKDFASERIRCTVLSSAPGDPGNVDTDVDAIKSKFWSIGRGKLYTIDHDNARRWAWARLNAMPSLTWRAGMIFQAPITLEFLRLSDWFSTTETAVTETVTADAEEWTVTNPGNIPAEFMTIRLRANATSGISNPKITNVTTGYVLESTFDSSSANDELRIDTENGLVESSDDDGASYDDAFSTYVIPDTQHILAMKLNPGANIIRYEGDGTPNLDVTFSFYGPWA